MGNCRCCGKISRRRFLTIIAALGLTLANFGYKTRADVPHQFTCEEVHQACIAAARQEENYAMRLLLYRLCDLDYLTCIAARNTHRLTDAMMEAGGWIVRNPGAAIGTVVVLGGATFIIIASDGALLPVFAGVPFL